jgi:outer membrane protein OmpA-like peptidoglycan-associated protein
MKRFIVLALLVAAFGVFSNVQAQFNTPGFAWGLSLGGAQGDNAAGDKWGMQYRGFLQADLISDMLVGQVGVGYTELYAPGVYSAATGMADVRLLFSPFSLPNLEPYLYAGFGVSKALSGNGNDLLAMIPFGLGLQTRVSPGILLSINGGYNLSLSDQMDGHVRANNDLNSLTNGKQDGFYGFSAGLAFTIGGRSYNASKDREFSDAEAQRVKLQADAEAQRVKLQADAEAQRVKLYADAEAQRVRDLADAEARRLADQKSRDTVFVFVKGSTVILKGVNFEFDKATLTKDSEIILWRAYNAMVANGAVEVVITGHTDNIGTQEYNQVLSLERAQTVRNWLAAKGITSNRMRTVGRGQNETVASNDTDAGRAENRRIEFFVEK